MYGFVCVLLFAPTLALFAQITLTVDVSGDVNVSAGGIFSNNTGDLRGCLNHINQNSGNYLVQFTVPAVTLGGILPLLNLNASNTITIDGAGAIISGNSNYPGFFVRQGNVTIQNLTLHNCIAQGGSGGNTGGGGGLGAGGALFIDGSEYGANVTIANVQMNNNQANGGNTSTSNLAGPGRGGSGGGGLYGGSGGIGHNTSNVYHSAGGTGGGGIGGSGGEAGTTSSTDSTATGGGGIGPGGDGAASGDADGGNGNSGGGYGAASAGGANIGDDTSFSGGSHAGGGGSSASSVEGAGGGGVNGQSAPDNQYGYAGGYGGGGGGSGGGSGTYWGGHGGIGGGGGGSGVNVSSFTENSVSAGAGNFGGGGGSAGPGGNATSGTGASGGFGGGGGSSYDANTFSPPYTPGGSGGVGAGNGGNSSGSNANFSGGGGAGFGGAIFINDGGRLTIQGGCSTSGNNVTAGTPPSGATVPGSSTSAGTDLFALSSPIAGIKFNPVNVGDVIDFAGTIADDSGYSIPSGGSWTPGTASGASLNVFGLGTVNLTTAGPNTYSGNTNITGATLVVNTVTALGNGNSMIHMTGLGAQEPTLTLNASGTIQQAFVINGGTLNVGINNVILTNVISGVGPFTLEGTTGSLTLTNGGNTYSGETVISGGTLTAGVTNAFPESTQIELANSAQALLNLAGFPTTIEGLFGVGPNGNVTLGGATLTLNTNSLITNDYKGVISGGGSLIVGGNGLQTLSNVNTYAGSTTIESGSLQLGINNAIPAASPLSLTGPQATLDLNNFNLSINSIFGVSGSQIILNTGILTVGGASTSSTYFGSILGIGGQLIKTGTGTFTLGQDSATYTGTTSITGGVLQGGADDVFSPSSLVDVSAGATLNLASLNETIGGLIGAGDVTLGSGALTITSTSASPNNFAGALTGTNGSVIIAGTNTQIFSGSNLNTYSGSTTIESGSTLQAGAMNAFSPNSAVVLAASNAVLNLQNNNNSIASLSGVSGSLVSLGTGILTSVGSGNTTFSGTITGSGIGGLTLSETPGSILTLSGVSTYMGATTINTGNTLAGGAVNAFSPNSAFTLNGTGVLSLGIYSQQIGSLSSASTMSTVNLGSATLTLLTGSSSFAGMMINTGNLTLNDSVMLTLSGTANTYSGTTTINDMATLTAGADGTFSPNSNVVINGAGLLDLVTFQETISTLSSTSSSAKVNLGTTGTLSLAGTIPTTYAGRIFGSGGIAFNESTTFTLTGTGLNTYSGPTILNSGTFAAGNNNVFSSSSPVTINNAAILALNNFPQTISTLASTSPSALVSLGSATLTMTGATSTDYQGAITGTGGLTLSEMVSTIFTLSGTGLNTYSGATIIMNGNTLSAGNVNVFSPSSPVTLNGMSILALNTFSQTITTLSSMSSTALVTLGTSTPGGGTLTLTGTTSTTYAGGVTGSGGITFNENATFLLTGSGLNIYTGPTILNSGTLQAGAMNVFSPSSPVVINNAATLDLQDFSQSISTLSGTSSAALVSLGTTGTGILTLTGAVSSDYQGAITGAGGLTLSEAAGAVFTLSGSGLINYSGPTILNSGTLRAGAPDTLSMFSSVTIFGSATLDLNNFAASIGELSSASPTARVTLGTHVPGTGNLQLTGNVSSIYAGTITGTGGLTVSEAPGTIFTLSGTSNTYSGTTRVLEGTLQAGAIDAFSRNSPVVIGSLLGGGAGILDLNDKSQHIPSLASSETSAQVLLGMGTLILTRDVSTSYAGSITGTGGLTLLGSDTFRLDTTGLATYSGPTRVDTGTLQAGAVNVFSPFSDVILLHGGVLDLNKHDQTISTLASTSFSSKVLLGRGILTFTGTTSTTFDGVISGTGGIVMDETATFTLRGLNIYQGQTIINSGTLSAGNNNTFSSFSEVDINNVGTLDLNGFFNSIDSLSAESTGARVTLGNGTTGILTLVGSNSTAFNGIISGGGGLSKTGPSIFTLTNNNTYTGPTNIFAGELVVDGALVSNQVNIHSGGTLKGPGPISSNVIIYSGGTDRPGGITTQQIIGSYKQNPGSKLVIELNATTSALIDVTGVPGTATIEGSTLQVIALRDFHYSPVFNIYEIIRAPGQVIGRFGSTIFSRLMINPQVIYSPTDVIITFGLGLQTLSCITGNALRLLNYINENVANADVQSILFDLEPVLSDCPSFLAVLESLDPARYGTLSLSCLEMGLEFASALNNRVMINHSRRTEESGRSPETALLSMSKPDQIIPQGSIRKAAREEKNWDIWADGFDECIRGPTDSQNPAFNTNLYGVLLGAEKWLPNGMVGFGAGYADARVSEKQDLGTGKLRDYTAFLYGSAYWNNWYFDLGAFGSFLKIHSERNFLRPLVHTGAVSDHHAIQATLHFATGYDFPTTWGTFEPFGFADWVVQTENKFEETGSPYDMRLRSRKLSMLRSEAGLHYYQNWKSGWGACIMKETFAYVNKAPFSVGEMEAAIIGVPGVFLQNSYTTVENLFHGGVQVFMTRHVEGNTTAPFFSLSYDVEIGSGYLSNAVQGMVGLYF